MIFYLKVDYEQINRYKSLMLGFNNSLPIIQAPMAGGITTPELVGAVSKAGAIGSFGFAYSSSTEISRQLREVRKITKNPLNCNFFLFPEIHEEERLDFRKAAKPLTDLSIRFDTPYDVLPPPYNPSLKEQLEVIWTEKPEILTFHFGVPNRKIISLAKSLGITIGVTVTNKKEAKVAFRGGVDFFVAQGLEAGGHLGYFHDSNFKLRTPSLKLLKSLKQEFDLPIISAGGIMNGFDIQKHINSGATGVQMGTAFLCCHEAGTNPTYKKYILEKKERPTEFTKGFSGRWARSIQNEFTVQMKDKNVLPFPVQNRLTGKLRAFAAQTKNGEYLSLWAGKEFRRARTLSASELIEQLIFEMKT